MEHSSGSCYEAATFGLHNIDRNIVLIFLVVKSEDSITQDQFRCFLYKALLNCL